MSMTLKKVKRGYRTRIAVETIDIKIGRPRDGDRCMIAVAAGMEYQPCVLVGDDPKLGTIALQINGSCYRGSLPVTAASRARLFDLHGRAAVKPFGFTTILEPC